jgi:NAD(P)-dependent dehydrogenase (short-subunit alcohol dehydrogenase family)
MSFRACGRLTDQTAHRQTTTAKETTTMSDLLTGKTAIIYGGGGDIGAAVAQAFARDGATVHLAGRTPATLDAAADAVRAAGGNAETAVLDALDEAAVERHVADVATRAGSVDISFNLITRGDVQGVPLIDMGADDLMRAVDDGLRSNFLTARAAARQMTAQGSGVILHLNSASGGAPCPAWAAPARPTLPSSRSCAISRSRWVRRAFGYAGCGPPASRRR